MIKEIQVPSPGESVTEVAIDSWLVRDGDYVKVDQGIAEIASDKTMLTLYSEFAGTIKILVNPGEVIPVGTVVCSIDTSATASSTTSKVETTAETKVETQQSSHSQEHYAKNFPSASAQKLMEEKGIKDVEGTGKDGRITKADVLNQLQSSQTSQVPAQNTSSEKTVPTTYQFSFSGSRNVRREKMSMLRRILAERLVSVKNETAMLTTFNEVDLSAIVALRAKYKDKFKETHGAGLGFMSFFAKACSEAIKAYPVINAQIDNDEIIYFDYVDMGIAVSTERGLVVPVVRNCESLSLAQIEKEILDLATKARNNKLKIEEMMNGTFTITNGGVFGSLMSTPIINPPQSAILGMHAIKDRPVVVDGKVEVRPMMYIALSYDHRIIDGKESVSFLVRVKELLEDPARLLLEI
jgi:2-oxoglutarate dehydrogenase E2 component (dihydrolipoamide succinyltransferase)